MTLLEEIATIQNETAQAVYEKRGRLTPKVWVQGPQRMIVAEPLDRTAIEQTTDEIVATLLCAMAARAEALFIGRSDEALTRPIDPNQPLPRTIESGDLILEADIDPTVRTCLVTEAVALGGSEEITIVATHGLDDDGRHSWKVTRSVNATMTTLVPLRAARDLIDAGLPDYWRDETALTQFAYQIRWIIREFPEPERL